jgi:hypothetical protein
MTSSAPFDGPYIGDKYDPNLAMIRDVDDLSLGFMYGSAA